MKSAVAAAQPNVAGIEGRPGRTCPLAYRYSPRVFDRAPDFEAHTLYAIGGLYGNVEALEAVLALAGAERGPVTLFFNGDFHWFDVDAGDFARVGAQVASHRALRGNVETEIAGEASGAGCGCAYPADVGDDDVERSNAILERLRATAAGLPRWRAPLASLPMHALARVGDARIGLVHGDATALAGWGFARERLDAPRHRAWIESVFRESRVDVFAASHTCLPALRGFEVDGRACAVANNGAAGMPNFAGTRFGVVTRIGVRALGGAARLYGHEVAGVHVEALRVDYAHERWLERFAASWPPGSAAHASYHRRMVAGPALAFAA